MNKKKSKKPALTSAKAGKSIKISDYFMKQVNAHNGGLESDNKRKFCEIKEDTVLRSVINYMETETSPICKKNRPGSSGSENNPDFQISSPRKGHNNGAYKSPETTPNKQKQSSPHSSSTKKSSKSPRQCTPKKLFEKSPGKLAEFDVKVLENFVRLTPSKKNNSTPSKNVIHVERVPNLSPSASELTSPLQQKHETTPKKKHQQYIPSCSKNVSSSLYFNNELKTRSPEKNINDEKFIRETEVIEETMEDEFDLSFSEITDEDLMFLMQEKSKTLELGTPQHCKIVSIENHPQCVILCLKNTETGAVGKCLLKDYWMNSQLKIGSVVYINGIKSGSDWVVDNKNGLLVYEPDFLISSTSVVGSIFCKRRSVLSEKYHGFDPSNQVMTVGVLVHSLLQTVLKEKIHTSEGIIIKLKEIIASESIVRKMYESSVTMDEIESEMMSFVPEILNFVQRYVKKNPQFAVPKKDNWKGEITAIEDIEENFWCPELGIKGKVDVTVKSDLALLPLELKTGKASVSMEHRGQVILYIMMMNKFGYNVTSGLLFYLREGVLREIPTTHKEERDIVILRNELAYYISKQSVNSSQGRKVVPFDLPEPIVHPHACGRCPYQIMCTSYLKYGDYDFSKNKKLSEINASASTFLSDQHLDYFMRWSNLLRLEYEIKTGDKSITEIYTNPPETRENKGRCIANLKVISVIEENNFLYKHTFEKSTQATYTNFLAAGIDENNYIIVSTDKRPAVASGFVKNITVNSITITIDRNLNKKYANQAFHLDTYESSVSQTFNLSCLTILLENTPQAANLRHIVIDKEAPQFSPKLPALVAKRGAAILKRLNVIQQKAVLKALSSKNYFLIKGMPGTGKTATIVALIRLLVALDKTVLVTSHTHSAVDNVCNRLLQHDVNFIRLGSLSRVGGGLKEKSEFNLTKGCSTPEELEKIYNSFNVIAVTCLGAGHPLLSKRTVDVCIVDESTQVLQSSVLKALYSAKKFILIGDPDQLAPVVRNKTAIELGMSESLFERLKTAESTITLTLNYRMNKTITGLANAFTYEGALQPANEAVANNVLKVPNFETIRSSIQEQWILQALDSSLENCVQFIDTGPIWKYSQDFLANSYDSESYESQNCKNIYEADIVKTLVDTLIKGGVSGSDIGIIATYRAQVAKLLSVLESYNVEVSTIDQFQGRDKNVIIYSCTKTADSTKNKHDILKYEILEDKRRLTVALTRAKQKLLIIGDRSTLRTYSTFSKIFEALDEKCFITLERRIIGF